MLVYVTNSLDPGGAEKLVVEMSLAFDGEFRVHVLCLDRPGLWAADLQRRGIPVHCLARRPGLDLRLPLKLARALKGCRADIVHAHQCTPWFYSALSRLLYRKPRLLIEEHGREYPEVDNRGRQFVNRLLIRRLTHRFVAVSEDMKQRLRRFEGLEGEDIQVIYNGVALERRLGQEERESLRRDLGFAAGDFVVGTIGRFDPVKNLSMLVRSLAAARASAPRMRGLLVGDGPELAAVRALTAELGISDAVVFPGYRPDARRLVQCLDLFVLSSFSEGASIALLEAVAAGIPVVVTDVGGNVEIVVHDETGWIVPSGSEEALSAAIVRAAGDPELCARLTVAGLRRLEQRFTFDQMLSSYREVYEALLSSMSILHSRVDNAGNIRDVG